LKPSGPWAGAAGDAPRVGGPPVGDLGLVRSVATELREGILPHVGARRGREHAGRAGSAGGGRRGDVTFAIDAEAERLLAEHLCRHAPEVACYSEDRGLVVPEGSPDTVLVVDPVDGTRPAVAGLESCCVSVAAAPFHDGVTLGEVTAGCVVEIPSGAVFLAGRDEGLVESPRVALSSNDRLDRMLWAYGFRGRPARPTTEVIAELIDASSVGGASFELGSAAFDMTRILTGQLDAYVEPGPRLVAEVPGMRAEFERVGHGAVLNNSPYDVAAAVLCLSSAGAVVTDAGGGSLDDRPLLGSSAEHQVSVAAAANAELHSLLVSAVDAGIERLAEGRLV
jgi:myo-inositol-1(or 4)-monophosphatase